MNVRFKLLALPVWVIIFFVACNDQPSKNHGPIRLGDSSTIVTEKDPQKLQDLVTDLQPDIPPSAPDSVATPVAAADTGKKKPVAAIVNNAPGVSADFEEVSVFFQNITARQAGNKNLQHANGAVYTLQSGTINGNIIKTTGNVSKVSQRYQAVVVLKCNLGSLPLEALSVTTSWEALQGGNNLYKISGLDAKSLETPEANNAAIKKAVAKAAQRRHFSRKKTEEWLNAVHNVRAANQKPLSTELRSVMWKIDGKDTRGKVFSKQIRIDIPF